MIILPLNFGKDETIGTPSVSAVRGNCENCSASAPLGRERPTGNPVYSQEIPQKRPAFAEQKLSPALLHKSKARLFLLPSFIMKLTEGKFQNR